jgi:hypothetical protein
MPPLPPMTAERARDIGRAHQTWAKYLADHGLELEAAHAAAMASDG